MTLSSRISFFLIFCLSAAISFGQITNADPSLFFEQPYALQNSDLNSVTSIFKDSHHSMWFGTTNGLYRYDGLNLHYFGHRNGDSTTLPDNDVLGIAEGKDDKLWVALRSGIAEIDPGTFRCRSYNGANKKLDEGNYTNRLCADNEGNIWVGNNEGIFLFDKKKQVFTSVWKDRTPKDSLSAYVTGLVNANPHLLIASTFHSLVFFNKDNYSFKRIQLTLYNPPNDTSITSIFVDSKQKVWVGTWGGGIFMYDLKTDRVSHIDNMRTGSKLPFFYATSFYETSFNKQRYIWVSTTIGLIKCAVDSNSNITNTTLIEYDRNYKYSIIQGALASLYLDSDGALWCGGDNGVCKCFPFQNNFKPFTILKGSVLGIKPIKIHNANCYFVNSWYSSSGSGYIISDSTGKEAAIKLNPHFTTDGSERNVSGIAKDRYGRIWISSFAGVSVLDDKGNVVKLWNKSTQGENNLTYYRISGIEIRNDTVWIACYHRGIDLFDLNFKKLCHFPGGNKSGFGENITFSFYNDLTGNLWVCGNVNLYKYLPGTNTFKSYSLSAMPGGCGPRDIAETKNGNLIIASEAGLIKFDPRSEKYAYITSDLLEKEQRIISVAVDENDDIWFLTEKHLVHYKPNENRFVFFGEEDGLDVSKGLNELQTFNGADFYVCQNEQVVRFNCDSLNQPASAPYLTLGMEVNDSSIYINDNSSAQYFPYYKNKIQFEFTGVSYIKAAQNQYYYKLSAIDKEWNISYKNAVSYANLSPGEYTFIVKSLNYAGMWSNIKTVDFIITPPYWQTWWFRSFSVILIISVLFYFIRYISQRNLKVKILQLEKETAVERERNRIAQDMHDDLGSGLTKIAILSEVVKNKLNQPEGASEQLENISNSSRTLVDNLQDIIWMLNTKNDQLDSLVAYIREYATKYFEQSDITISFDYPATVEDKKIREKERRNLFLAIKEALNNIAKHSKAKHVIVKYRLDQNALNFVISDDGEGFKTDETRKFANGIKGMRERIDDLGGKFEINSKHHEGTTISITLYL